MPKKTTPLFPMADWWLPALPLLPLIIFTALSSGFIEFTQKKLEFLKFDFEGK